MCAARHRAAGTHAERRKQQKVVLAKWLLRKPASSCSTSRRAASISPPEGDLRNGGGSRPARHGDPADLLGAARVARHERRILVMREGRLAGESRARRPPKRDFSHATEQSLGARVGGGGSPAASRDQAGDVSLIVCVAAILLATTGSPKPSSPSATSSTYCAGRGQRPHPPGDAARHHDGGIDSASARWWRWGAIRGMTDSRHRARFASPSVAARSPGWRTA